MDPEHERSSKAAATKPRTSCNEIRRQIEDTTSDYDREARREAGECSPAAWR